MRSRIWTTLFTALLIGSFCLPALAQSAAPATQAAPDTGMSMAHAKIAPGSADKLKLDYAGKSAEYTAATLAALPHTTVTVFNEHAKANQTFSGVPLTALLTRLGVPDKPRGREFRLYLLAEGADGYGVVYSVAEVTPDVHDATVIVADTLDSKPLTESGPFQLVSTGEKRPARWVRNLTSVRVISAP